MPSSVDLASAYAESGVAEVLDQLDRELKAAQSIVYRRTLRRFGAMSISVVVSNQGRITIPLAYRDHAALLPNNQAVVIGCEIGVEVWNCDRWQAEAELIQEHVVNKGQSEMDTDLKREGQ